MNPGYLVALALFLFSCIPEHPVIVALCWLALWLLEKGGWRHWCGWAIVAAVALLAASVVLQVSR